MIEAFKTEIIEAEKNRTDLLKWKLIIVATLIAVGFGIGSENAAPENIDTPLALTLIPAVAFYVDLLCIHLQFRILVISEFFQNYRPEPANEDMICFIAYEKYCAKVRSVFNLEDLAQVGSTIILSGLVMIAAFCKRPPNINFFYFSGGIGIVASICLFYYYQCKVKSLKPKKRKWCY